MNTLSTGELGEQKAELYLKDKGYKIIDKNFRTKIGEIDLIAEEAGQLVFIEVKYRKSNQFGAGFEAVNQKKLEKISQVAQLYLKNYKTQTAARLDVVSIDGNSIRLFRNVLTL